MEINPISVALWTPRNIYPNILERKSNEIINEGLIIPKNQEVQPKYIPSEKARRIANHQIDYLV